MNKALLTVFEKGSTTYFYTSLFFPEPVKTKVFELYSFVRIIDDFVDQNPSDSDSYYRFVVRYAQLSGQNITQLKRLQKLGKLDQVVDSLQKEPLTEQQQMILVLFIDLKTEYGLKDAWIQAFLSAMEADLYKSSYNSQAELLAYIHGSAEVVGLCMAKILGLPVIAQPSAKMLGRSMQYINFIRDIGEDLELGRQYFPVPLLKKWQLTALTKEVIGVKNKNYQHFLADVSQTYMNWQQKAETGYQYIPLRYLLPIKTASDMYTWTVQEIISDPQKAYQHKIKPTKSLILFTIVKNFFQLICLKYI